LPKGVGHAHDLDPAHAHVAAAAVRALTRCRAGQQNDRRDRSAVEFGRYFLGQRDAKKPGRAVQNKVHVAQAGQCHLPQAEAHRVANGQRADQDSRAK
jgi:hypothetical protein